MVGPFQRAVLLASLAFALAGCASEPPTAPIQESPSEPTYVYDQATIDGYAYPQASSGCGPVPAVCLGGAAYPSYLGTTPEEGTTVAIHLDVGDAQFTDDAVDWRLTCTGDDQGCRRTLAKGQSQLPFSIDVANVTLAPETDLYLQLVVPSLAPGADLVLDLARGSCDVTGTMTVRTEA